MQLITDSKVQRVWKGFWQLADPKIWTASLVPISLGWSLSASSGHSLNLLPGLLSILVVILIEIGKNGFNEFYDYLSGADRYVEPENRTDFSGGKKVIVDGLLSLEQVWRISLICTAAAVLSGLVLVLFRPGIIWFGLIGLFFALAYSIPPLQLSYRGLGEAAVGFTFGPLIVNGTYYLHTGRFDFAPILLSIPIGFLITNVLWINQIPDVEADRKAGKWNLVARKGRERALNGYVVLFVLAFISILIAAIALHHLYYLIALTTLLLAVPAIQCADKNRNNTHNLIHANALTIQVYLFSGLLMAFASFI